MAKAPKQYFVHVHDDGRETAFDAPPDNVKTLRVERVGKWEQTLTYNIHVGDAETVMRVRPKFGRGGEWEMYGLSEMGNSTVWRRRRKRK